MDSGRRNKRECNFVWHHNLLEFGDRKCFHESKIYVGIEVAMEFPVQEVMAIDSLVLWCYSYTLGGMGGMEDING